MDIDKENYLREFIISFENQSKELKRSLSNLLYQDKNNEPEIKRIIAFYNFIEKYICQLEVDNIELMTIIEQLREDKNTMIKFMGPHLTFFYEINQHTKLIMASADKTFSDGYSRN